ncbi:MAG: histidinol-phosphate transaminase [Clostridia bacterium]|nr:histidinol-phosphate transaminase [Clostridia bacterium]
MSRFFSEKYKTLVPYVPGEQPKDMQYIKLNTNESPFPPAPEAIAKAAEVSKRLQLYCDPECRVLTTLVAKRYGVQYENVLMTNGSDEILNFAFMAFCDKDHPAVFPNITYGFYSVFAEINGIPYEEIPLDADFSINVEDYIGIGKNIFIANPNAPTGIALSRDEIERIVASNPDNVVVIDEAYVDFGGESCIPLIEKYDNLLVTQTFSKSRSMAGARLGYGIGCAALIADLNTIKYSTNPYNVNSMTQAAGIGTILYDDYSMQNCQTVIENREFTAKALSDMGFEMTDSKTNFLFARHKSIDGQTLYEKLRARGILVRHFSKPLIAQYNRITVGSREQMQALIDAIRNILEEQA